MSRPIPRNVRGKRRKRFKAAGRAPKKTGFAQVLDRDQISGRAIVRGGRRLVRHEARPRVGTQRPIRICRVIKPAAE